MKRITLVLIIMVSLVGYSQDCKFLKNEIDEFTKTKITKLKGHIIFNTSMTTGLFFQVSKINDQKYITFLFNSGSPFTIVKDQELMFKSINGQILNIKHPETQVSESSNIPGLGLMFSSKIIIPLTEELIEKFKNFEIVKARFYTKSGYVEENVKKKNSLNISNDIKCIETI